jgi:hypothetical protein
VTSQPRTLLQLVNPRSCCRTDLGCVNPPIDEATFGHAHIGTRRIFNPKNDAMVHAKITLLWP